MHHDWSTALDNGGQVDVVFIDFAKAFDLVNHSILLNKLYKCGIRGSLFTKRCKRGSICLANTYLWCAARLTVGFFIFIIYIKDLYQGLSVGITHLPYMKLIANYIGSLILLRMSRRYNQFCFS